MDGYDLSRLLDDAVDDLTNARDQLADAFDETPDQDALDMAALAIVGAMPTLVGLFKALHDLGADVYPVPENDEAMAIALVNFPAVAAEAIASCEMAADRIRAVAS